mmetsp:Transcript_48044/g.116743  ORF Transcript_48044/g.116743 Transcript_48044/m.116743 type:complete len:104 (-) Transcript_48044:105-416(-)
MDRMSQGTDVGEPDRLAASCGRARGGFFLFLLLGVVEDGDASLALHTIDGRDSRSRDSRSRAIAHVALVADEKAAAAAAAVLGGRSNHDVTELRGHFQLAHSF